MEFYVILIQTLSKWIAIIIGFISVVVLVNNTGLLKTRHAHALPRVVDAVLAGVSIAVGISILFQLDKRVPVQLYHKKMIGSTIVFMSNTKPPPLTPFVTCSCFCFIAGIALLQLQLNGITAMGPEVMRAVATGCAIVFWRLSSMSFSAAIGLITIIGDTGSYTHWADILTFLVHPWLLGHALLYVLAWIFSEARAYVRVLLTGRELREGLRSELLKAKRTAGTRSGEEKLLRTLFDQLDTSRDGRLDATEFKVAIRKLTGNDASLGDCQRIIELVDIDGNGKLDFAEFCRALEHHHDPYS